jgi:hypothetical protein
MGNTIISFEDFQKKSKNLKEDTIMPTGDSTVFVESPERNEDGNNEGEEKNYMFFKNLYTMKKCIEEMMEMNKDQVDELIEKGHDWASDHISSSKDDIQEVYDWLRYEIDNIENEEGEEGEEEIQSVVVDVEGNNDNVEVENGEEEEEESDDDDDDEEEEDEDEDKDKALESKYSYTEEKN